MKSLIIFTALVFALVMPLAFSAQSEITLTDFSLTLNREGCLGDCPSYEVTILGDGQVKYEGHAYVRVKGVRERVIPSADVRKLAKRLQDEGFFRWDEKDILCVDFPVVHITAKIGAQRKHVLEGCNTPGRVLFLADEIDRVSGTKRWVP